MFHHLLVKLSKLCYPAESDALLVWFLGMHAALEQQVETGNW